MDKSEIVKMLNIKNFSPEYYELIKESNRRTRNEFGNQAFVFAQLGINGGKCEGNCKFCSMAEKYYSLESEFEKSENEILDEVKFLINEGIDDLFLMTTVGYSIEKFLKIGKSVAEILPSGVNLVANIGDFSFETALKLKDAGFTGAYHIKRLREGIDTDISISTRLKTIENIKKSGLSLYYCIEPIGPEHT
ncbi:MAG: radical SAM protein, partial [Oscillospiraceae bacterium]